MDARGDESVGEAVRRTVAGGARLMLAVSGGRDSMAMLDAFARIAPASVATVATFDHATGGAATLAAAHVARETRARGLAVVAGRAEAAGRSEAEWRAARWHFLRTQAARLGAVVATAHTRDDQTETVLMRTLRGSGARGLAGLAARGDVVRPFLAVERATVASYAVENGIEWLEDPTNTSTRFLRNRVRLEMLPALLAVRPALEHELLTIASQASELRHAIEDLVDSLDVRVRSRASLRVAASTLGRYDQAALCMLWPAIAARAAVTLDRRGTVRLARFTTGAVAGDCMQLSGLVQVTRERDALVLAPLSRLPVPSEVVLSGDTVWGRWRFVRAVAASTGREAVWRASLPAGCSVSVRAWRPGDRMRGAGDATARRVKRFLRDAGIVGPDRVGWPVVVAGAEIVWIPGVRRSDAATDRPGGPGATYLCDRIEH